MTNTAWYWFYILQILEQFTLAFCSLNNWPVVSPGVQTYFLIKYFSSEQVHTDFVTFFCLLICFAVIWSQPDCSRTGAWKMMALWRLHAHWSHTVCLPTEINTPSEKVLAPFKTAPAMRSVPVGVRNDTSCPGYSAKWRAGSSWPPLAGSMAPNKVAATACGAIYLTRNVLTLTRSR